MALIVQKVDGAIHGINHCPAKKHKQNQLSYLVDYIAVVCPVPYEQLGPPGLLFLSALITIMNLFRSLSFCDKIILKDAQV